MGCHQMLRARNLHRLWQLPDGDASSTKLRVCGPPHPHPEIGRRGAGGVAHPVHHLCPQLRILAMSSPQ